MFSAKFGSNSKCIMKHLQLLAVFLVPVVTLLMGVAAPQVWAQCELEECSVIFEFNSTDMDAGIQFFWDGEPWERCTVENPNGEIVLDVNAEELPEGLTEGFFEGAEPEQDNMGGINQFIRQFPNGTYTFTCYPVGGGPTCDCEADLNYQLLNAASLDAGDFPAITWTESGNVTRAEIVIEAVVENGDEQVFTEKVIFEGGQLSYTVSEEFQALIETKAEDETLSELKVEILIDRGGNKTITEEEVCWALDVGGAFDGYVECLDED